MAEQTDNTTPARHPGGRPSSYSDELMVKAWDYLENYEEKYEHPFPSLVGMCKILNRSKTTLYNWGDKESNVFRQEFRDILDACNEIQQMVLLNKGITGEFNSSIAKLVLGKHGYHDKQDQEITGKAGSPVQFLFNPVGPDNEPD